MPKAPEEAAQEEEARLEEIDAQRELHLEVLDKSFRGFGHIFTLLTKEQGRVEAELKDAYPDEAKQRLGAAIAGLEKVHDDLRATAYLVRDGNLDAMNAKDQDEV